MKIKRLLSLFSKGSKLAKTESQNKENSSTKKESNQNQIETINGLPFAIIKQNGKFYVAFGKHLISEHGFEESWEAKEWLKNPSWNAILNCAGIIAEHIVNEKLNKNE